jgi:hypothetical protein
VEGRGGAVIEKESDLLPSKLSAQRHPNSLMTTASRLSGDIPEFRSAIRTPACATKLVVRFKSTSREALREDEKRRLSIPYLGERTDKWCEWLGC